MARVASRGRAEDLTWLAQIGFELDVDNPWGKSSIECSCFAGNVETFRLLRSEVAWTGARVTKALVACVDGWSAAPPDQERCRTIASELLACGADPLGQVSERPATPWRGADFDKTPLGMALRGKDPQMFKLLALACDFESSRCPRFKPRRLTAEEAIKDALSKAEGLSLREPMATAWEAVRHVRLDRTMGQELREEIFEPPAKKGSSRL